MGYEKRKRPLDTRTNSAEPDVKFGFLRVADVASAAVSTALSPRGVYGLTSTSTGAAVVWTVKTPTAGDVLEVAISSIGSSSGAPFHVNAGSGVTFDGTNDMITMSTAGAGFSLRALSTARWLMVGNFGATLSTST